MPTAIPVKFRYASCDLLFDPRQSEAIEGDHVVCETERGLEIGLTTADAQDYSDADLHEIIGDAPLRAVIRVATEEDLVRADELAEDAERALPIFRRLAKEDGLDMKPVGVEYTFDGTKAVCYFSADERVDFRQLVRDLSHELHCRIDMRQIGVREEAALVGGYGHCGQELCCARFGHQFEPVSIRMAKEQDLLLNSAKISGACGRLMCCLRYEFEAYRDFKQRAPKRNAIIDTPLGKAKIVEYNTPKEELAMRLENGKTIHIKLADMTTSDAAVKKSEELNCPCRPDTVTRDILEKLSSPDVQMALAELDRQYGADADEQDFDESDIFVSQKAHPRSAEKKNELEAKPVAAEKKTAQPRRRRHRIQEVAETQNGRSAQGHPTAGRLASKKKDSKHNVIAPQTEAPRRRRRHHKAEGAEAQPQMRANAKQNRPTSEGSGTNRRLRRRPGDRGGAADRQTSKPQGGFGAARKSHNKGNPNTQQTPQPRKRVNRRRHRDAGSSNQND